LSGQKGSSANLCAHSGNLNLTHDESQILDSASTGHTAVTDEAGCLIDPFVMKEIDGILECARRIRKSTNSRHLSALQRIRPIPSPGMLYLLLNLVVSKSEES
jgi:hypothetical protein